MATEAQVRANRLNARKSAGPRTPEGKAKAAQNSLKHGLFAREGVIRGEDREEFEMHREMLLEQLDPVGPLEAILAARVVDLTWRLRRAAQDENEAFGALYDRHTDGAEEPQEPDERAATLGRMILADFGQDAVLERLLRYERRIEGSLYRTLNELRRVHDQGRQADQEVADTLGRWHQEDAEARKARAFAFDPPGDGPPAPPGGTTNTPRAEVAPASGIPSAPYGDSAPDPLPEDETCETNPIGGPEAHDCGLPIADCGLKDAGLGEQTLAPVQDEANLRVESCKTNPISPDPDPSRGLVGSVLLTAISPRSGMGGIGAGQSRVLFLPAEQVADLVGHGSG